MYTVSDVMTRNPVSLKEDDDLALAENIIHLGRLRHLPVVRRGKLVGLVTQRDLLHAYARRGEVRGPTLLASDVMRSPVVHVRPDTPAKDAFKLMLKKKYGCAPVVEKDGTLVGIVTESDGVAFAMRVIGELDKVGKVAARVARPR